MAVYAFPRATLDIDILIEPETLEKREELQFDISAYPAGMYLVNITDGRTSQNEKLIVY